MNRKTKIIKIYDSLKAVKLKNKDRLFMLSTMKHFEKKQDLTDSQIEILNKILRKSTRTNIGEMYPTTPWPKPKRGFTWE